MRLALLRLPLVLAVLLASSLLTAVPATADTDSSATTPVVVSEMATRGPAGATDNFIELRNVSEQPVDISGWRIQRCNNSGFAGTQVTVAEHVMAPGEHYLVAHTDFSGDVEPDATYGISIADTGGGRILDTAGEVVDGLGFADGDNRCTHGNPAPALTTAQGSNGMAHTRDDAGTNTRDNATDFSLAARTPTASHGSADPGDPDPGPDPDPPGEPEGIGAVVISEIYGGGGNSGAPLSHDFVELFNRGDETVTFRDWSVQYSSAGGSTWGVNPVSGTIEPGQYFLVQLAGGANQDLPRLPEPDAVGTSNMAAGSGKVALVANTTSLNCAIDCLPNADVSDFVGYGMSASAWEGSGPTEQLSNSTSASRLDAGCVDTDDNAADFTVGDPAPRNSDVSRDPCPDTPPSVTLTDPADGAIRIDPATDITITFSEPVTVSDDWYTLSCDEQAITASDSGGPRTYVVNPDGDLPAGAQCTATVLADEVVDRDHAPMTMAADHASSFSVDDGSQIRIAEIQGEGHITPLLGRDVATVPGVVTAVAGNGFWFQDPEPNDDPLRSDGLFVFTGSNPATSVEVGDEVAVSGTASEFRPGGATSANLSITQLAQPTVTVESSGNDLPPPVVIGEGGRVPPTEVIHPGTDAPDIERDPDSFDPDAHGIDFFETLEGMRVQVNDAVAVGPTTEAAEITVVGDGGEHATGTTDRGGVIVSPDDFNPERLHLSPRLVDDMPDVHVGDYATEPIVGVMDYSNANYKLEVTTTPTFDSGGNEREAGSAPAAASQLAVSSFNVENLSPESGQLQFDRLADKVVNHLRSPDLLNLVEIQDNTGPSNDGVVDASETYDMLIAAIKDAGGPAYEWRDIAPQHNQDGGQPGGNIRVGFLFRTDRGLQFVDRPGGDATTPVAVEEGDDGAQLSISPGRVEPQDPAWTNSRKPLVGEFTFNGERLFVVGTHFLAKIADDPLFGRFQLPDRRTEIRRVEQARLVNEFVADVLAVDPDANVAVLGDKNDFHFSPTNDVLVDGGALINLMETLPENERYSYVFQGNSQDLDQFLTSPNLFDEHFASFELVSINAEFYDQVSDHDPNLAIFDFGDGPPPDPAPDPDPGPGPDPAPGDPQTAEFFPQRANIQAGQPVQVRFEVQDADGVPVTSADLSVTLHTPDGTAQAQPYATNPSGQYRSLVHTHAGQPGTYTLVVKGARDKTLGSHDLTVEAPRAQDAPRR